MKRKTEKRERKTETWHVMLPLSPFLLGVTVFVVVVCYCFCFVYYDSKNSKSSKGYVLLLR